MPVSPLMRTQWAQQKTSPSTSTPWPITRQLQCGQVMDGAFQAIEGVSLSAGHHVEALVVLVPAHHTLSHNLCNVRRHG
jgi:hypothetical protein